MPRKVKCLLLIINLERTSGKPILKMKNDEEIPYAHECNHLGNILSTISEFSIVDHVVNDLNMRTNCLLVKFFL